MTAHILIIEDEEDLNRILAFNLKQEGYQTKSATHGLVGLELASQAPLPALIILDLMLPDIPGTEVCRRLRENETTRNIPVLMCTARDTELDRVVGFELGADDYVSKPFSVRELMLRVRAILKRYKQESSSDESEESKQTFGCLTLDESAHKAWINQNEVHLTPLEFRLVLTLCNRKGQVQSRENLLEDVWGYQAGMTTRTVDTTMRRLRDKLGEEAGSYIETVRGVGYRFRENV